MKRWENYEIKFDIIDEIGVVAFYKDKRKVPLLYVLERYSDIKGITSELSKNESKSGLTTCFLYVGPHFGNIVLNGSGFVSLT